MPNFLDDYEPVEDRLRAFWSEHPIGRVTTDAVTWGEEPGSVILFKAYVWREEGAEIASTGYAHQRILSEPPKKRDGTPNYDSPEWTSPFEVCETSAIGRALANLGYAAKGKRPSREEMSKASGAVAGGSPNRPAQEPAPGTTSVDNGEVSAATGTGGGVESSLSATPGSTNDQPGPPHYPLRPDECDHKAERSGHLLRPRKSPRGPVCPRCGLSYITVTESTAADLGSA